MLAGANASSAQAPRLLRLRDMGDSVSGWFRAGIGVMAASRTPRVRCLVRADNKPGIPSGRWPDSEAGDSHRREVLSEAPSVAAAPEEARAAEPASRVGAADSVAGPCRPARSSACRRRLRK